MEDVFVEFLVSLSDVGKCDVRSIISSVRCPCTPPLASVHYIQTPTELLWNAETVNDRHATGFHASFNSIRRRASGFRVVYPAGCPWPLTRTSNNATSPYLEDGF